MLTSPRPAFLTHIPDPLMRTLSLSALLVAAAALAAQEKKPAPKEAPVVPPRQGTSETIKLFNGTTLDGWEGYPDLWAVKDGVIVARNDKPLKFSTYLLTKKTFTDFRLTFS